MYENRFSLLSKITEVNLSVTILNNERGEVKVNGAVLMGLSSPSPAGSVGSLQTSWWNRQFLRWRSDLKQIMVMWPLTCWQWCTALPAATGWQSWRAPALSLLLWLRPYGYWSFPRAAWRLQGAEKSWPATWSGDLLTRGASTGAANTYD